LAQDIDRGKRHTPERVEEGLRYLAMNFGKARRASREMEKAGLEPLSPSILDYWKKTAHAERYQTLLAQVIARRDHESAEQIDALVRKALGIEKRILQETDDKLDTIPAKDLPNAFKNLAIGSGVLRDKADRMRGKPDATVRHTVNLTLVQRAIAQLEQDIADEETTVDGEAELVE
jgi:hypothetical protein